MNASPPTNSFAAGWNLLTTNPGEFFSTLINGDASNVKDADVQTAATNNQGFGENFGAGLGELQTDPGQFVSDAGSVVGTGLGKALNPLTNLPSWVYWVGGGVLVVIAIGTVGYTARAFK